MDQDMQDKIIEQNPNVDPTAIARFEQAKQQLESVGIKLGGYRLTHALGGLVTTPPGSLTEQGTEQGTEERSHAPS